MRNEEKEAKDEGEDEPGGRSTGWSVLLISQLEAEGRACCCGAARLPMTNAAVSPSAALPCQEKSTCPQEA